MLRDGSVIIAGEIVTPAKVVQRGQVERLELNGSLAGVERFGEASGRRQQMREPVPGVGPAWSSAIERRNSRSAGR